MSSYQAIASQFKPPRKMPRQYRQDVLKYPECERRAKDAIACRGGNHADAIKVVESQIVDLHPRLLAYREGKQVIGRIMRLAEVAKEKAEREAREAADEKRERRIGLAVKLLRSAGMGSVAAAVEDGGGVASIVELAIAEADQDAKEAADKQAWSEMNRATVVAYRLDQVKDELFGSR